MFSMDVNKKLALTMAGVWISNGALAVTFDESNRWLYQQEQSLTPKVIRENLVPMSLSSVDFFSPGESRGLQLQKDERSGIIRLIEGKSIFGVELTSLMDADDNIAEIDKILMNVVDTHEEIFGIRSSDLKLNSNATLITPTEQFFNYFVYRDGILVEDAHLAFRFNRGRLVQVLNETFSEASWENLGTLPGLDQFVSRQLFQQVVQFNRDLFRVISGPQGYRLRRVAEYQVTVGTSPYLVQADAETGKIAEVRPTHVNYGGTFTLPTFPRYYKDELVDMPVALAELKNVKENTSVEGVFTTKDEDTVVPEFEGLKGKSAIVSNKDGPPLKSSAELTPGEFDKKRWRLRFKLKREDKPEEGNEAAQIMGYQHVNQIVRYARGFINPKWFDRKLPINVNINRSCNAYWNGTSINFFRASRTDESGPCANTALISDVIYHEWGHGLHSNTSGIRDGAYSEGFGDAMSMMMTKDYRLGVGFIVGREAPLRNLKDVKVYPRDRGEAHKEGLIFGSTMWELYTLLNEVHGPEKGQTMISNFLLKSIYTTVKYTESYNSFLVIDDNDGDLSNGTPNLCLLNKVFVNHGLAKKDDRCVSKKKELL